MGTYGATWVSRGYCGQGAVGELLGSLTGRSAIVCGSAEGVFEEFQQARAALGEFVVFAANDVGMYLDRLDHWVSLHGDNLDAWKRVRWLHHKGPEDVQIHSVAPSPSVQHVWEAVTPVFALSGYFAMQLAWIMGAERIVLCGCPGTQTRRFFEGTPRPDFGYGHGPAGSDQGITEQIVQEMDRVPEFKAAVRSCSGWTAEFFGVPEFMEVVHG